LELMMSQEKDLNDRTTRVHRSVACVGVRNRTSAPLASPSPIPQDGAQVKM
jgi:hypothetical protein